MAGTGIRIDIDAAEVRGVLKRLVDLSADPTPMLDEIGQELVSSVIARFERGQGPSGEEWKLSERARREGGVTLVDSARLRNSITHRADADKVEVGTNVVYAAIHQFGGVIRPRNKRFLWWPGASHPVRQVTIPARPFLGLDDNDRATVSRVAKSHLSAG